MDYRSWAVQVPSSVYINKMRTSEIIFRQVQSLVITQMITRAEPGSTELFELKPALHHQEQMFSQNQMNQCVFWCYAGT